LFYAISAAKNMLIYGANTSNAFAEAPPPKQGFYIYPDRVFKDWWIHHKKNPPIPDGHVILVLGALQGHPESPCLLEKHVNKNFCSIGFAPTVHKPCIYSGTILNKRVLFMQRVDDFAISAPSKCIANHVDLIKTFYSFQQNARASSHYTMALTSYRQRTTSRSLARRTSTE
jgi:hypothetical protein